MKQMLILVTAFILVGCNHMHVKPGTMDKSEVVWAYSGGNSMRHAIKYEMEDRGYKVIIGRAVNTRDIDFADGDTIGEVDSVDTMRARYIVKVKERTERFAPIWCAFNGFWFWRFNISIADQKTGEELLNWAGRGCANSSLRKLNRALDELERK